MAALELTFIDQPPPPQRAAAGSTGRVTDKLRANGRPKLVTETGDRYTAPHSHRAHGTHVKYTIERCRCLPCTVAARVYNRDLRRKHARPDESFVAFVPARRARRHLEDLQRQGIGHKTVAEITAEMANGAQRVDAARTWQLLNDLLAQGFYKAWIARQLHGPQARALQIRPNQVRASTARAVEQLHAEWSGRTPPPKKTRHRQ